MLARVFRRKPPRGGLLLVSALLLLPPVVSGSGQSEAVLATDTSYLNLTHDNPKQPKDSSDQNQSAFHVVQRRPPVAEPNTAPTTTSPSLSPSPAAVNAKVLVQSTTSSSAYYPSRKRRKKTQQPAPASPFKDVAPDERSNTVLVSDIWGAQNRSLNLSYVSSPGSSEMETWSPKTLAVLVVLAFGIIIGIVINFVNLHTDFEDLQDFFRGYQGRKLLISEGKLTSREYLEAIRRLQHESSENKSPTTPTKFAHFSQYRSAKANGHVGNGHVVNLARSLSDIQEERRQQNPHCHANFEAFTTITPFLEVEPVGRPEHLDWLEYHLPLYASMYIEDHDPEWRDLDYSVEVGPPPEEFIEFIRQYEWHIYCFDRKYMSSEELSLRDNLFYQFRKWKKRRRKIWRIVVTERAKKEMADQDNAIGSRR